jgi:MFS-type transporter involved in bile tolerance (Atg22 family)
MNSYENVYGPNQQDKNIVFEMWKSLGGEIKAHVTLNNLRIFLFAIMGTFVEPGLPKES